MAACRASDAVVGTVMQWLARGSGPPGGVISLANEDDRWAAGSDAVRQSGPSSWRKQPSHAVA